MTLLVSTVFTKSSGQPATGLTLAEIDIYLYSRAKSGGTVATVWDGVNPTEEVGGGIYTRSYSSDDPTTYDYFAYAVYSGATVLDCNYSLYSGEGGPTPAEVWSYSSRTLTQTAAAITAILSGTTLTIHRGDSMSISFSGLGDISSRTNLQFTLKRDRSHDDNVALIQIDESTGLLVLNGSSSVIAGNGVITVTGGDAGDFAVTLTATNTAQLSVATGLYYDVQMITASSVSTLTSGGASVTADVTRATS